MHAPHAPAGHDAGRPGLVPVADHLAHVLSRTGLVRELEVDVLDAPGRRLARDVSAAIAVPPWDNSAMDGYAVHHADVADASPEHPVTLRIVADLPAGSALDPALGPGEAARIMTGAPLPSASDAVVQLEHTDRTDPVAPLADTVTVLRAPTPGMHVRRAGEDRRPGDLLVPAGTLVTGPVLAALVSAGVTRVWLRERPRVTVISTGDELAAPGAPLRRGAIPDSNSLLLAQLVREAGGELQGVRRVRDDAAEVRARVLGATAQCGARPHVIVLTGGVSQGAFDPVKQAFAGSDRVRFVSVAMQPGKPQAFGRFGEPPDHGLGDPAGPERDGALVFGLPGNPVSAWVSFHVFVRPALLTMAGAPDHVVTPPRLRAVVETGWRTPGGRDQYLPARIRPAGPGDPGEAGGLLVSPAAALGSRSNLVASLALANGYAIVPTADQAARGGAPVAPGDVVDVVLTSLEPARA